MKTALNTNLSASHILLKQSFFYANYKPESFKLKSVTSERKPGESEHPRGARRGTGGTGQKEKHVNISEVNREISVWIRKSMADLRDLRKVSNEATSIPRNNPNRSRIYPAPKYAAFDVPASQESSEKEKKNGRHLFSGEFPRKLSKKLMNYGRTFLPLFLENDLRC